MKKLKNSLNRIVCFLLACFLIITSESVSVFAFDYENPVWDEMFSVSDNATKEEIKKSSSDSDDTDEASYDDILPDMMDGEDYDDYDGEGFRSYEDDVTEGKLGRAASKSGIKYSGDIKNRIMTYVDSLNGHFTSPYMRGGKAVAKQCCAYVNQVWHDVFAVDLYSLSEAATSQYSYDGESAYEFLERVGLKTGDVIYTRYQKAKKNKFGGAVLDKNGGVMKTMGQHFVIVLDYDENYIWYTDGYESRSKGFIVSSKNRKVRYSDSKYFRNVGGAFSDIEGAYYAKAGKRGCRFRYYRLPDSVYRKNGGSYVKANSTNSETVKKLPPGTWDKIEKRYQNKGLRLEGISANGYEYSGTEICPEIRVFDRDTPIDEDKYSVVFSDNTDAGTATVWVTVEGKHRGCISENFIIKPYDIAAHYEKEAPDVAVRDIVLFESKRTQKVKPLVSCMISINSVSRNATYENADLRSDDGEGFFSDNSVSENTVKYRTVFLKNDVSCIYSYPSEGEGAYKEASETPYIIRIEGKGNFTGVIEVKEYINIRNNRKESYTEATGINGGTDGLTGDTLQESSDVPVTVRKKESKLSLLIKKNREKRKKHKNNI